MAKRKSRPPAPRLWEFYCCTREAPCELHTSSTKRQVILTSPALRDAVMARATLEGTTPRDLILRVLNEYLGRAAKDEAPLRAPGWVVGVRSSWSMVPKVVPAEGQR